MGRKVVIFGTGSFGRILHFYLGTDCDYEVVGFTKTDCPSPPDSADSTFSGLPLVPFSDVVAVFPPAEHSMFVAVGYRKLNALRAEFYTAAKALGYELISYISSKAAYSDDLIIGDNSCILPGSTIEPFVALGNDVVVWGSAHISHDSSIGDHSFLAPGVVVAGFTHVGRHCFVGANATLRDGIRVGDGSLIGAGAVVAADTKPGAVYLGPRATAHEGDASRFLR